MRGSWHELGPIIMLVLDGFLYSCVDMEPLVLRVMRTSKNAIWPFSSSSLVNQTLGCTLFRQSLKSWAGSLPLLVDRRPGRMNWREVVVQYISSIYAKRFSGTVSFLDLAVLMAVSIV